MEGLQYSTSTLVGLEILNSRARPPRPSGQLQWRSAPTSYWKAHCHRLSPALLGSTSLVCSHCLSGERRGELLERRESRRGQRSGRVRDHPLEDVREKDGERAAADGEEDEGEAGAERAREGLVAPQPRDDDGGEEEVELVDAYKGRRLRRRGVAIAAGVAESDLRASSGRGQRQESTYSVAPMQTINE